MALIEIEEVKSVEYQSQNISQSLKPAERYVRLNVLKRKSTNESLKENLKLVKQTVDEIKKDDQKILVKFKAQRNYPIETKKKGH